MTGFRSRVGQSLGRIERFAPLRIGVILAVFMLLERWLLSAARLPETCYESAVISFELVRGGRFILGLVVLIIFVALTWSRERSVRVRWKDLAEGARLRCFLTLCAVVIAWPLATSDYNLYFDRAYYADRALLLGLAFAVYWRPVFLLPLLPLLVAVGWQFSHPLGGYSTSEQMLFVRLFLLFVTTLLFWIVCGRAPLGDFVFLACCLLASSYWASGVGKSPHTWVLEDQIHLLLPATHASGWLAFVEADTISSVTRWLAHLDWPMRIATIIIECGALFVLWRRGATLFLLGGWALLHVGIFGLTGICFWKWIVIELALLFLLWRPWRSSPAIFKPGLFVTSLVVIAGSPIWFKPAALSWSDAAVSYAYRMEAITSTGARENLPPAFFAPNDYEFTLSLFRFVSKRPVLPITWGATTRSIAERVNRVKSADAVFALESELGAIPYDETRARAFDGFITTFVGNFNRHRSKATWWHLVQAPRWLWTYGRTPVFETSVRIEKVLVTHVTSFFDGESYREIRKETIREIDVPLDGG